MAQNAATTTPRDSRAGCAASSRSVNLSPNGANSVPSSPISFTMRFTVGPKKSTSFCQITCTCWTIVPNSVNAVELPVSNVVRLCQTSATAVLICAPHCGAFVCTYWTAVCHQADNCALIAGICTSVRFCHVAATAVLICAPHCGAFVCTYWTAVCHQADNCALIAGICTSVRFCHVAATAVLICAPHCGAFVCTYWTAVCHQADNCALIAGICTSVRFFHVAATAALICAPHCGAFVCTYWTAVCHQADNCALIAGICTSVRFFHVAATAALICAPHCGAFVCTYWTSCCPHWPSISPAAGSPPVLNAPVRSPNIVLASATIGPITSRTSPIAVATRLAHSVAVCNAPATCVPSTVPSSRNCDMNASLPSVSISLATNGCSASKDD